MVPCATSLLPRLYPDLRSVMKWTHLLLLFKGANRPMVVLRKHQLWSHGAGYLVGMLQTDRPPFRIPICMITHAVHLIAFDGTRVPQSRHMTREKCTHRRLHNSSVLD
jgi:hypothetical protein